MRQRADINLSVLIPISVFIRGPVTPYMVWCHATVCVMCMWSAQCTAVQGALRSRPLSANWLCLTAGYACAVQLQHIVQVWPALCPTLISLCGSGTSAQMLYGIKSRPVKSTLYFKLVQCSVWIVAEARTNNFYLASWYAWGQELPRDIRAQCRLLHQAWSHDMMASWQTMQSAQRCSYARYCKDFFVQASTSNENI